MGLFSKDPNKGIGSTAAKQGKCWITGGKGDRVEKTVFGGRTLVNGKAFDKSTKGRRK